MRAIGWNIWKGFACFSSFAWLGSLAFSQESTATAQVASAKNQRGGRAEKRARNYSMEPLMPNESTPAMRKQITDKQDRGFPVVSKVLS